MLRIILLLFVFVAVNTLITWWLMRKKTGTKFSGRSLGCLLGMLVSITVAFMSYKMHVAAHFPWLGLFEALGISLLTGTLLSISAAILPAYMAAKKQPVDAMRVEE